MLDRTDAITKEVLEPITFVLTHPTVYTGILWVVMKKVLRKSDGEEEREREG
jgi:hypothetical protein